MTSSNRLENLRGVIGAGLQHTSRFVDDMEWLDTSSEAIGINVNRILEDVQAFDLKKHFLKGYQESSELKHLIDKLTNNHHNSSSNNNNYSSNNGSNNSKYQSGDKQTIKRQRDYNEELPDPKKKMITTENATQHSSSDTCRRVLPFVNKTNNNNNNNGNLDLSHKHRNANDKLDKKENFENSKKVHNGNGTVANNHNGSDHNNHFVNKNNNMNGHAENGHHSNDHHHHNDSSSSSSSSSRSQVNTTPGNKKRQSSDNSSDHNRSSDRKESKNNHSNNNGDYAEQTSIKREGTTKDQGRDHNKDDKGRREIRSNNNNNNNNNANGNADDKISKSTSFNQPAVKTSTLAMQLDAEGRDLKHIADCKQGVKLDKTVRATKYIEAGLKFIQSLECREDDPLERMSNIIMSYNRIAQYFKESAHMFVDWQKDKDCPSLSLFVTLCNVCESVLLYKRHCKLLPSLKKKRDEKAKEVKTILAKLTEAPREQANIDIMTKLLQDSSRFMDELTEILSYVDPWDKAITSSKSLSNFTLPPAQITLKELVSYVKRELGVS